MTVSMDLPHWVLNICPVKDRDEAKTKLHQLAQVVTELSILQRSWAAQLKHEIARYQEAVIPAIIQIPGVPGIQEPELQA